MVDIVIDDPVIVDPVHVSSESTDAASSHEVIRNATSSHGYVAGADAHHVLHHGAQAAGHGCSSAIIALLIMGAIVIGPFICVGAFVLFAERLNR